MNKKQLIGLFSLFLLNLILLSVLGFLFFRFANTPLVTTEPGIVYELHPGSGILRLASDLKHLNLITNKQAFILLAKLTGQNRSLKAGEYLITPGTTAIQLLHQINHGVVIIHNITFIEGKTFNDLEKALATNEYITHTLTYLTPEQIMPQIDSTFTLPEGLFFPDTYHFKKHTPDRAILKIAHDKMMKVLQQEWQNRRENLPYKTPYDALIAASLIEKESAADSERPYIAGVLINRLEINMPLQFDPTVIYGLGKHYTGKLKSEDMRLSTPYNTYLNKGLPPTPIAMPSLSSIHAALNPIMTNYLYFVAKGDGTHTFSATLELHSKAVDRLRKIKQQQRSNNEQ